MLHTCKWGECQGLRNKRARGKLVRVDGSILAQLAPVPQPATRLLSCITNGARTHPPLSAAPSAFSANPAVSLQACASAWRAPALPPPAAHASSDHHIHDMCVCARLCVCVHVRRHSLCVHQCASVHPHETRLGERGDGYNADKQGIEETSGRRLAATGTKGLSGIGSPSRNATPKVAGPCVQKPQQARGHPCPQAATSKGSGRSKGPGGGRCTVPSHSRSCPAGLRTQPRQVHAPLQRLPPHLLRPCVVQVAAEGLQVIQAVFLHLLGDADLLVHGLVLTPAANGVCKQLGGHTARQAVRRSKQVQPAR